MGAYFAKTGARVTETFEVGLPGGRFQVAAIGLPTDGVLLELPEKAIEKPIRLSIGYCTGSLRLRSGTPSGVVLWIQTSPQVTFQLPLKIGVSFVPSPKHMGLVGYSIDEEGRLRPIDILNLDMKQGRVTFLTFQPMTLTWAFIEK